jgi:hypothetical protein
VAASSETLACSTLFSRSRALFNRRLARRCLYLQQRGAIGHDLTAYALKLGLVNSYHGAEAQKGNDASSDGPHDRLRSSDDNETASKDEEPVQSLRGELGSELRIGLRRQFPRLLVLGLFGRKMASSCSLSGPGNTASTSGRDPDTRSNSDAESHALLPVSTVDVDSPSEILHSPLVRSQGIWS